ncbi:MAG TPA: alanine racemase [Burkholderiaceae bacterium]
MPRPLTALVHTAAMRHNLQTARRAAPGSKAWAVVKANAYGHSLRAALTAFADADGLALIEVDGAVRLRELGWQGRILLLEGFFDPSDLSVLAQYEIETAVHSAEQLAMLESVPLVRPLHTHLKMNSGMNRLGFMPAQFRAAYERLRAIPGVASVTLMTHFANADDAHHGQLAPAEQMRRFAAGAQGIDAPVSVSNSAGTLLHAGFNDSWIRPGIMLYGDTPGGRTAEQFGLLPAMTLRSALIGVQQIDLGEAVGYGSRYVASCRTRVGVVACGYADGYPRHAPDGTPVLVDGVRTALVGRVSMDMIMVDLTPVPGAGVGSNVVLWGEGLPIDEVANAAGTIGYELMCAVAPRVHMEIA